MAAGHPEIEYPGIEVTTGPLGQGIANAVGLAVAGKHLAATYNRPGYPLVDGTVWCFTGDGCLQEGVGQEALSLAGHWGLDNLVLVYDNNGVTVDGSISNCFTEDTSAKARAMGWEVIDVEDGTDDVGKIVAALQAAKAVRGKPTLVNIRTVIGVGSAQAGQGKAHGQALGDDQVAAVKRALGFDPEEKFAVRPEVYDFWAPVKEKGSVAERAWDDLWAAYQAAYPAEGGELSARMAGRLDGWEALVPPKSALPTAPQPTRKSSGIMIEALAPKYKSLMVGSADLLESTFVSWRGMEEFQAPTTSLGTYAGRQIRYGIREFAMAAVANGLAAYHPNLILPVMSTFFMFWLYAAPAARMAALQRLRWIGIATHDSIGIGEDGPTHQPVELASLYRAMPGIELWRPADAEEVMGAWLASLRGDKPVIFTLSRQAVPLLPGSDRAGVARGGYVVHDADAPELVLLATGAEVARALDTAALLPYRVRVVSLPSTTRFDAQPRAYRRSVIPPGVPTVAIEAWASMGWARYAHAGCHMHGFGLSAPQEVLFEHFGFSPAHLAKVIGEWAGKLDGVPGVGEFEELLLDRHAEWN
jgi:dihydroxyacetone synthase